MAAADGTAIAFSERDHDHDGCVMAALDTAERLCTGRGARLTRLRRRVLELVWSSHAPVGAYELLRRLADEQGSTAPPTIYRALEFLRAHGLIHRIESLNAFIGCPDPTTSHAGQFLICRTCGAAAELDDPRIERAIARRAAELGFAVETRTVELSGLCPGCRPEDGETQDVV